MPPACVGIFIANSSTASAKSQPVEGNLHITTKSVHEVHVY
jgi:hypothetical protein